MDYIIASTDDGAHSDASTDDGADDMMVVTEAVFHLSPCPWIKLAHDLLVKAFVRSNFFICHRVVEWKCFRRFTIRQYLQLDNKTNELTRADVKAFLRVQEGNLRAEEVYMQCKWTRYLSTCCIGNFYVLILLCVYRYRALIPGGLVDASVQLGHILMFAHRSL